MTTATIESAPIPAPALPHWDVSTVYPSLDSAEFAAGMAALLTDIDGMSALFDRHNIAAGPSGPVDAATVQTFEAIVSEWNRVLLANQTLAAYIQSFVTTDSRDTTAAARMSELQAQGVRVQQTGARAFTAWLGGLDVARVCKKHFRRGPRDHAFMLEQAQIQATHLMSPAEEALSAELGLTGSTAWSLLYGNLTSQLMVPVTRDGQETLLGMPAVPQSGV